MRLSRLIGVIHNFKYLSTFCNFTCLPLVSIVYLNQKQTLKHKDMTNTAKIETIMTTLKEGYTMMLAFGMDRVEARKVVLDTLTEMGLKVTIAEEIING